MASESSTILSGVGPFRTSPSDAGIPFSLVVTSRGMESRPLPLNFDDVASVIASFAVGFVGFGLSSAAVEMTGLVPWCDTIAFASAADASVAAWFSPGFVTFGFNSGGAALTDSAFSSGALSFASLLLLLHRSQHRSYSIVSASD
jgi:hypothetical protein